MARDVRKLRVFQTADTLVLEVYRASAEIPADERYGLRSQIRRAAVSIATNIVEGSARRTTREYVHFLNIANGSSAEALYLLSLAHRLRMISDTDWTTLSAQCSEVSRGLQAMRITRERS